MPSHEAHKPLWFCQECRRPWPCEKAQQAMAAGGINTSMRLAAWYLFEEAARDLPHVSGAELYERFIGWMKDVPAA